MATVLIVDDSRTSRKILRGCLEEEGHTIIGEAVNGEEGVILYKEKRPDLVTMDITMPKMDGIEALRLIRKENENAKVVMITAAGQQEKIKSAIKYGAADFFAKPFEPEAVKEIISRLLKEE